MGRSVCSPPGAAGEWLVVSCGRVSCSTAGGRGSRGRAREPGRLPGAQLTHGPGPLAPAAATLSHHQPPSLIPLPLTSPATPTHFASIKPCLTRVNAVIKLRRDNYRCDHRPFAGALGRRRGGEGAWGGEALVFGAIARRQGIAHRFIIRARRQR